MWRLGLIDTNFLSETLCAGKHVSIGERWIYLVVAVLLSQSPPLASDVRVYVRFREHPALSRRDQQDEIVVVQTIEEVDEWLPNAPKGPIAATDLNNEKTAF